MTNLTPVALRLAQAHAGGGWEAVARVVGDMVAASGTTGLTERAKIVAQILTDNGQPVYPPDDGDLDDVEHERWEVCLQIVQALGEARVDAGKEPGA